MGSRRRTVRAQKWAALIPEDEWAVYKSAIDALRELGKPFLLGGAFGLATYTGRWRNTKDMDVFVLPRDREAVIRVLTNLGFADLHPEFPYDRNWIYRATRSGVVVDVIWSLPNKRTDVDELWFTRATPVFIRGEQLLSVPPEELVWIKLYVLQRDRTDWPDVLNLLHAASARMDWGHLLARLDRDVPLLAAVLHVFDWLSPNRARQLPESLREKLHLPKPSEEPLHEIERRRAFLLDSRPWFSALQPADEIMKV